MLSKGSLRASSPISKCSSFVGGELAMLTYPFFYIESTCFMCGCGEFRLVDFQLVLW